MVVFPLPIGGVGAGDVVTLVQVVIWLHSVVRIPSCVLGGKKEGTKQRDVKYAHIQMSQWQMHGTGTISLSYPYEHFHLFFLLLRTRVVLCHVSDGYICFLPHSV